MDVSGFPLPVNCALFALFAAVVWWSGTRIARVAEVIRRRTGIGEAVIGLVLLGAVTSLPELAVTLTSSLRGNAALAVNNVTGSIALNVTLLAIADARIGRDALTSVNASPSVLLQGALGIALLCLVAVGTMIPGVMFLGVDLWTWALVPGYLGAVWMVTARRDAKPWVVGERARRSEPSGTPASRDESSRGVSDLEHVTNARLGIQAALAATAILAAGYAVSRTGEVLAEQTGLGASFAGFVLLAFATSLPELSTITAAVKLRRYSMAIADAFGTNLFNVLLLFLVDVCYRGGSALAETGRFATVAALLGIAVTATYLVGLVERRDRTILRMGYDSLAVIAIYGAGLWLLYGLR